MSSTKLFCDMNGQTVELSGYVQPMKNAEFAAAFPGVKGKRFDSFDMRVARAPDGRYLPVTRSIVYKGRPSLHKCDARCMNATGRTMKCECACGGKNHGAGAFNCSSVQ